MSSPVHTVGGDCTLEQAARIMLDSKIGCLPIVDPAGKLIGILTESDFAAKSKGVPVGIIARRDLLKLILDDPARMNE